MYLHYRSTFVIYNSNKKWVTYHTMKMSFINLLMFDTFPRLIKINDLREFELKKTFTILLAFSSDTRQCGLTISRNYWLELAAVEVTLRERVGSINRPRPRSEWSVRPHVAICLAVARRPLYFTLHLAIHRQTAPADT